MQLHVLCIAYEQPIPLRMLCDCFLLQTDHRWSLKVIHDGPPSADESAIFDMYNDPRIIFTHSKRKAGNWGNTLRNSFLKKAVGAIDDYILITNHDNIYVPRFVEFMLECCNMDTGMVYCNTVHNHLTYSGQISEIHVGKIDGGALIVSLPIAQAVGYKNRSGHADGLYALACKRECVKRGLRTVHINKFLFIHN